MLRISYHSWKDYLECPKKHFLKDRKKQPPSVPRNDYFTLYGKLTEKFFQLFCNTWRYKTPVLSPEEIRSKLDVLFQGVLESSVVDWTAPFVKNSQTDIFEQSFTDICSIMASKNREYFLNSRSEISVEISTKDGACINGRIDFVYNNPQTDTTIIFDGKGASDIGKNVSDDQVLFYALLYFFHFKVLPQGLGFLYYRFNTFKPVAIDFPTLNAFRGRLSLGIKQMMTDTAFKATPSPKSCKYCDYRTTCAECLEDQAKRKKPSKLDIPDTEGVINLGF